MRDIKINNFSAAELNFFQETLAGCFGKAIDAEHAEKNTTEETS